MDEVDNCGALQNFRVYHTRDGIPKLERTLTTLDFAAQEFFRAFINMHRDDSNIRLPEVLGGTDHFAAR